MAEHGRQQVYDKERVHWNTAWMKTHGEHVEVVVNPDEALEFKRSNGERPDISECVRSEHVFSDAKKGELAKDEFLQEVFSTQAPLEIAKELILKGELQISAEHRAQMRDEKKNRIVNQIQQYAIDPKTGLPHPRKRIELAMDEVKIKVDEKRDEESQIQDIVRKLQPVIPIRLETVTLQVLLPNPYGQKLYGELERFGTLKKTDWMQDGGLLAWLELPAGMQNDLIEELGSKTHGGAEVKKIDSKVNE